MAYLVLARKYRPATFADVIGQDHITELLRKAISAEHVAHAYLFCGPRGIGKTSCARILAKSLNCQDGPTLTPCGNCASCQEISKGSGFDVIEIDGASNRGIDEIRTLRENVKFSPSYGKYKIYIVDEVHMLTGEAFNALLKTLEEPPEHAKFIFATTEPHKLPATILSRCQRYDFKRIALKTLVWSLAEICQKENFTVTQDALYAIAKAAQGSFRDALSVLDQISALSERQIEDSDVYSMLGLVESKLLFDLTDALQSKDCSRALELLDAIIDKGKDIKQLARDLVEHFRNLMVMKVGGKSLEKLVDYTAPIKEQYYQQAQNISLPEIFRALDEFIKAQETGRVTETLRTPLEIVFARLTYSNNATAQTTGFSSQSTNQRSAAALGNELPVRSTSRVAPTPILKDNRGSVNIVDSHPESSSAISSEATMVLEDVPVASSSEPITLEKIQAAWDALTYAVSREKMSLATFLQEGKPAQLVGQRLTIAFSKDHQFHKETLDGKDAKLLVDRIFSEKLRCQIVVEYKILDGAKTAAPQAHEPVIQKALDTFKGKIVSKWHNE
ncbi:MAG: DNA polymerase III subunit gamma/tau [Candidatus Omnitrophica bacterium]|nr:DNA polymerase III subunit gamma/tau [Candidatus Omnitrophota bacterium]